MTDNPPLSSSLAIFATEIRASTLRRFERIQPADWAWRPRTDLLTFADVLEHLVDADRWLLAQLDGADPSQGVVISPGAADPAKSDSLLAEFRRTGQERTRRISMLSDQEFSTRRFDLMNRGTVNLFQLISRCNFDHEIHHRGALQLAIRLRYAGTT
jgi:uncharacterized damage-inducible protein DinB